MTSLSLPSSSGQCGVTFPDTPAAASHRIVGGTRTLRGEFPWQVLHLFFFSLSPFFPFVLINVTILQAFFFLNPVYMFFFFNRGHQRQHPFTYLHYTGTIL